MEREQFQVIVEQYRRRYNEWKHYDTLLWQIPFSTSVATGTVLTLVYRWVEEMIVRKILMLNLIIFVLLMMILAIKIRLFQIARTSFLKEVERNYKIKHLPVETKEALTYLKRERQNNSNGAFGKIVFRIYSIRAFHLQLIMYSVLIGTLVYLIIFA